MRCLQFSYLAKFSNCLDHLFILCSSSFSSIVGFQVMNYGFEGFSRLFVMEISLCQFSDKSLKCGSVRPQSNLINSRV
jgi:hypothetical protein